MRKRSSIQVVGRRQKSPWTDSIRPSSAQTISSPQLNNGGSGFPGSGDTIPCANSVPTPRTACYDDVGYLDGSPTTEGSWGDVPNSPFRWVAADVPVSCFPVAINYRKEALFSAWNGGHLTLLEPGLSNTPQYRDPSGVGNFAADENDFYSEMLTRFTIHKKGLAGRFTQAIGALTVGLVWDWIEYGYQDKLGFGTSDHVGANEAPDGLDFEVNEGGTYYTRLRWSISGGMAKVWNLEDDEPEDWMITTYGIFDRTSTVTHIDPADCSLHTTLTNINFTLHGNLEAISPQPENIGYSEVAVHSIWAARAEVIIDDCFEDDPVPGYYFDTLLKSSNYWIPASDVSYYKQVYFNGLPVFEGTHYWLDGLKLHPTDPAIFDTTIATAEVVIN